MHGLCSDTHVRARAQPYTGQSLIVHIEKMPICEFQLGALCRYDGTLSLKPGDESSLRKFGLAMAGTISARPILKEAPTRNRLAELEMAKQACAHLVRCT